MSTPADLDIVEVKTQTADYYVVRDVRETAWGFVTHLEIHRVDNQPVHDWYELQSIKTQVCGAESLALEIYPTSNRLVDAQHAYHLWVVPKGFQVPFGIHDDDQQEHHPEDFCKRCGGRNISWFAPSPLWNSVVRAHGHSEILCPICFAELAEAVGVTGTWKLDMQRK